MSAFQALLFSGFLLLVITYGTQANDALIGDACAVDRNCITPQTVCGSGSCRCFNGHTPSEDRRNCIASTRGVCFDDSDCRSLQSSRCFIVESLDGTCTCNDGFTSSEDTRTCLSEAGFQGSCQERGQCTRQLGINSVCAEGRCNCQAQFHFSLQDRRCIMSVGLQGNCVNSSQCVAGGSQNNVVCENGICSCASGFVRAEDSCRAGAQNAIVSGTVFLLYLIIKVFIV